MLFLISSSLHSLVTWRVRWGRRQEIFNICITPSKSSDYIIIFLLQAAAGEARERDWRIEIWKPELVGQCDAPSAPATSIQPRWVRLCPHLTTQWMNSRLKFHLKMKTGKQSVESFYFLTPSLVFSTFTDFYALLPSYTNSSHSASEFAATVKHVKYHFLNWDNNYNLAASTLRCCC